MTFIFIIGFIIFMLWVIGEVKRKRRLITESSEFKDADYAHICGETAISLNKSNETLFLAMGETHKTYMFSDIRSWSNGRTNTGNNSLLVKVRDIDHPRWRIEFKDGSEAAVELPRWREILNQNIGDK